MVLSPTLQRGGEGWQLASSMGGELWEKRAMKGEPHTIHSPLQMIEI